MIALIGGAVFCSAFAAFCNPSYAAFLYPEPLYQTNDTLSLHYPVQKTVAKTADEWEQSSPVDLRTPENIKQVVEYDWLTDSYKFRTMLGDVEIGTPFTMSAQEYKSYTERNLMNSYFRAKNAETYEKGGRSEFSFLDMQFGLGPAERVFGPGGVQIKTQGSAEVSFGLKQNKVDNPTLPAKSRNKTFFDFDNQIQLNVNAKVGDKLSFGMNYNTDATFDFDTKNLKLAYEGKEDEIVKLIEAGNVSMSTGSSLIRGGSALFGMKTMLQFGKLNVTALIAQQESTSQSVNSKGGAQTRPFEFTADEYDEDRHFFLSHYFYDNYDQFVARLPYIASGVEISRIELWVTNRRGNFDNARNIVAFMDLAESKTLGNNYWQPLTTQQNPYNDANSLYRTIVQSYPEARSIATVTQALAPLATYGIEGGTDYVKIESARKLADSEYTLNKTLGYVSLKSKLNHDEVLAVAFEYTLNGKVYQVGEFSTAEQDAQQSLYLKLLKGTAVDPTRPIWRLMMKNVYALNAFQIKKERFRLSIQYMSDTTGVFLDYLQAGSIKDQLLLRVLNLDRLDQNNEPNPDGYYDYVEGFTVQSSTGRIIFPSVEPFGAYLAKKINDPVLAEKYCYFELYDSTLTVARQKAEKNKFRMKGEYRSSSGAEINLNAMNIPRGSVVVTAGGMTLTENSDYTVDYTMGVITILNQTILESGTNINVTLENQSAFSIQRKTMMGLDMQYNFTKNFTVGGTMIHLSERPLTQKVNMDDIPLKNTIYGFNTNYKTETMWLTNMVGKIPWVNTTAPSTFAVTAEYAQLIPGHSNVIQDKGEVYLDDFETSQQGYDIRMPYAWSLASTPYDPSSNALFPESGFSNDTRYGENRALFNWFNIDRLFTQRNSTLTPSHIKRDLDQLSNHHIREVSYSEIYPNKDLSYGESGVLNVLNLAYYPTERGPYNLDLENLDPLGNLINPERRWGGMMRKMDHTDFEAANYEYIQFWVMDPFVNDTLGSATGGDLYFNLGELSEDILKDGMKSYENGMPIDGDTTHLANTVWGRVSKRNSMVYAFDNAPGSRKKQDVGLDGLQNEEEYQFPTYKNYVERIVTKLSPQGLQRMQNNPFSPLNDPAGDNYHHFRGSDFDNEERPILDRYKYFNGVEGNSVSSEDSPERYDVSATTKPDVEDINQDNTLNEYERYYQYRISIRPKDMEVGHNFISDKKQAKVRLRNGKEETVTWYQFKVPLSEFEKQIGSIRDFRSIRFMRIFMTGFQQETHLRFASLELMRSDWRTYTNALNKPGVKPITNGKIDVSVVNIEENAGTVPVNYVLPPGVSRVVDPGQAQIMQLNEQSMVMRIANLAPTDARAVYKNSSIDMRRFKRLQMFVHAEALIDDLTNLKNGDLSVFIRLGNDYVDNYYEYEIPLVLTQPGNYNNNSLSDRQLVWPEENMFDFPLSVFTDLKVERNAEKRQDYSNITFQTIFSKYDPEKLRNKVTVTGNPTLSDVRTIMIGVRNASPSVKAGTVWVNELRLSDFNENGGWAGKVNMNIGVSDIGSINVGGQIQTAGFGSVDQSLMQRRLDDYYQYNVATTVELGKLLPQQAKITAPMFYSYSKEIVSPEYDPYNQDIKIAETMSTATKTERDSIRNVVQEIAVVESFSLSGVKVNIQSKNPMPWDPANFLAGYSYSRTSKRDPTIQYEDLFDYRGSLGYTYSPFFKPWSPFASVKSKSPHLKIAKEFTLNWLPNSIGLYSNIMRTYYEQQLRNADFSGSSSEINIPVSFSKNFIWDRQTTLNWDLTKSMRFSFNSATNSRVDEPNVPVNKRLFPDEYEQWKDTVMQNILKLGTPLRYNQTFDASYNVPLNKLPWFDWTTSSVRYNAGYNWDRGVYIDEFTKLGNSVNNQSQLQTDLRFNFEMLYNKSAFLKETNQKFATTNRNNTRNAANRSSKKFAQRVQLKKDTTITVRHNLDNKNIQVTAKTLKDETYPLKFKVKDRNTLIIQSRDSIPVQINVIQGKRLEEYSWYKSAQYAARGAMLVRNASVNYRRTYSTYLPSFDPFIGDFFGQRGGSKMAPGLGFAFGFEGGESYVEKARDNGWLIINDSLTAPAILSQTDDFQFRVALEPIRGLKIDLNGSRIHTQGKQSQFMFPDLPIQQTGTFTMTTIAIRTSLGNPKAANNYQSQAFDNFVRYRHEIADRLTQRYVGNRYPNSGFLSGTIYAGMPFDPSVGGARINSADVLIPAFMAAYTGKAPGKANLTPFPSLKSILPNWRATYDGLARIPWLNRYFRSITLSHAYRCTYSVGTFASFLNWVEVNDGLGFAQETLLGLPVPSSPFDISTVSITESFAPLLGIDLAWKKGITARAEYKDTRNLSLNMSSVQLVESISKDITIGGGYKIANFNTVIGLKGGGQQGVNHDLTLRADLTHRKQHALIRNIEEYYTQATSGNKNFTIKFTADYTFSKSVTIRGFYDRQINTPLVSLNSYPISNSNFGVTLRLALTR